MTGEGAILYHSFTHYLSMFSMCNICLYVYMYVFMRLYPMYALHAYLHEFTSIHNINTLCCRYIQCCISDNIHLYGGCWLNIKSPRVLVAIMQCLLFSFARQFVPQIMFFWALSTCRQLQSVLRIGHKYTRGEMYIALCSRVKNVMGVI